MPGPAGKFWVSGISSDTLVIVKNELAMWEIKLIDEERHAYRFVYFIHNVWIVEYNLTALILIVLKLWAVLQTQVTLSTLYGWKMARNRYNLLLLHYALFTHLIVN